MNNFLLTNTKLINKFIKDLKSEVIVIDVPKRRQWQQTINKKIKDFKFLWCTEPWKQCRFWDQKALDSQDSTATTIIIIMIITIRAYL